MFDIVSEKIIEITIWSQHLALSIMMIYTPIRYHSLQQMLDLYYQ